MARASARASTAARLHSVAIQLLRTVRVADREAGMSPARLSVLSILVFGGPRSLSELTEAEQVAAPTMTKLVAGLERDGLVRRAASKTDGRVWVIHATTKARQVLLEARDRRLELLMQLLNDSSSTDWDALEKGVTVLERALQRD